MWAKCWQTFFDTFIYSVFVSLPFLILSACSFHSLTSLSLTSLQRHKHTTWFASSTTRSISNTTTDVSLQHTPKLGTAETYIRTIFLTLKSSSGATSGFSPLSVCSTSCWTIRSNNTQYWSMVLFCLSADRQRGAADMEHFMAMKQRSKWVKCLTWHHETVLQCRQEVGIRLSVVQVLLDQLKHLAGTFSIDMDLRQKTSISQNLWCLVACKPVKSAVGCKRFFLHLLIVNARKFPN